SDFTQPESVSFAPPIPKTYVVQPGDTYASIAAKNHLDPSFANSIADSNGSSVWQTPTPGVMLTMPQAIPTTNKAGQYRAIDDFMQILEVQLMPHLKAKPPKQHHESFLRELIESFALA